MSAKGNGYLRVGEFRAWAQGLGHRLDKQDSALDTVSKKVDLHGELLAVWRERKDQDDTARKEVRKFWYTLFGSFVIWLLTALAGAYHILTAAH